MAHVSAGSEVVIERDAAPVAVLRAIAKRPGLMISEILARAKARGSTVTLDDGFGRDLEDAIASHPEPIESPWDRPTAL
jgi:hypothetical protein